MHPIRLTPSHIIEDSINVVQPSVEELNFMAHLWNIYQSMVTLSAENETTNDTFKNKFEWIKNTLGYSQPLEVSGELEEEPEAYLVITKKLRKFIKDLIYIKIGNNAFEIEDNRLDPDLDKATKILIDSFDSLFQMYFQQGNYDKAFESIKKISSTQQGWRGLLSLATIYLNQNDPKIKIVLNALKEESFPKEIMTFLNGIKAEKIPTLISFIKEIENETIKKIILVPTIIKFFNDGKPDYNSLIKFIKDDSQKKEVSEKIVEFLISKNKIDDALIIFSKMEDSYHKNSLY